MGTQLATFADDPDSALVERQRNLARAVETLQRTAGRQGVGSITNDHILANTITAGAIAAGTITAEEIAAGAITAAQIEAGTITANEIAAATITGAKIAAGTITATNIAAATITASRLVADTITANEIAASAITANELAAGAVTAGKILANTITAAQIAADTITGTQIAAATITGGLIAASTITATNIAAATITGSLVAAGTLTGDRLVADTITGTQITGSTLSAIFADLGTVTAGTLRIGVAGGQKVAIGDSISTSSGTKSGIVGTDAANAITFLIDSATGTLQLKGQLLTGSTGLGALAGGGGTIDGTTNIASATIAGSRLVADTITATQIAASAITSVELAAGAVVAGKIAAGTIVAADIQAGTITSTQLTATAIDAMTITGATFRTASSNPKVQMDATGLASIDAAGLKPVKITTTGLDLLASTVTSPPAERKIRWLRESDAALVGEMLAWEAGGEARTAIYAGPLASNPVSTVSLRAKPTSGAWGAEILLQAYDVGYIGGHEDEITLRAGGTTVLLFDEFERSDFQKMANPRAKINASAGTSCATATDVGITLGTVEFDDFYTNEAASGTAQASVANTLTCRKAGLYLCIGQIGWPSNATGARRTIIWKNGATLAYNTGAGLGQAHAVQAAIVAPLVAGDALTLRGYQTSGATLSTSTGATNTFLEMVRIGG